MTEFTDGYFKTMGDIARGYHTARKAREKEREELLNADFINWDKVRDWDRREKTFHFPFSDGYKKAYWTWEESTEHGTDILEVASVPWGKEIHDFVCCLKEAGVDEFVITDDASGLIEAIHGFEEEGVHIKGLCQIKRFGDVYNPEKTYKGILMEIK